MPVIEITRKGVYDANGKMMLPGTRVEKPKMPPAWKNKARIVPDAEVGKACRNFAVRVLTADNSAEFDSPASEPEPLPESVIVATPFRRATLSFSDQTPEIFDEAGFEALEYTTINEVAVLEKETALASLRADYEELTGKIADGRWSAARLEREIESIIESGQ